MDFTKFNDHFRLSLVQELDFQNELVNCERTRNHFQGYDDLYLPQTFLWKSSKRTLVMEYCRGHKIDDIEGMKATFGEDGAKNACQILVDAFGQMIFIHGMVHCDAHPGNIMVRPNPKDPRKPQVVLLDHGFYCHMNDSFRVKFCKLWYAMNTFDYESVKAIAQEMGMGEYFRYLPLLFTYRTINAKKPLGGRITQDEIKFLKSNDEVNFEKLSLLMQCLPSEVVFIFKAMHIIGQHNRRSGGETRTRLLSFTNSCIESMNDQYTGLYQFYVKIQYRFKLWIFENLFWLFNKLYGFKEYEVPQEADLQDKNLIVDQITKIPKEEMKR